MSNWYTRLTARGANEPVGVMMKLTPAMAAELLTHNHRNIPMKNSQVQRLVQDILGGRWRFNGETIIISIDGRLLDGQHRLAALVLAGETVPSVTITVLVCWGAPDDVSPTIDQGHIRKHGDQLALEGISDGNAMSAMAGYSLLWERDGRISTNGGYKPTKGQKDEYLHAHLDPMRHSLSLCQTKASAKLATRSVLATCHYMFSRASNDREATRFLQRAVQGDGLEAGDPILLLRAKLIGTRYEANKTVEYITIAWNAYRRGKRPARLDATGMLPKVES